MNVEKLAKAEKIYLDSIIKLEIARQDLRGAQGKAEAAQKAEDLSHAQLLEVVKQITR